MVDVDALAERWNASRVRASWGRTREAFQRLAALPAIAAASFPAWISPQVLRAPVSSRGFSRST
jgi:hypothetical protein